jgi:hypothetical protein
MQSGPLPTNAEIAEIAEKIMALRTQRALRLKIVAFQQVDDLTVAQNFGRILIPAPDG